jgi:hypothetical protein
LKTSPSHLKRRSNGNTLSEFPVALWIVVVGLGFPLFILGSLGIRFGLFWEAAREAAQNACQAQTFYAPPDYGSGPIAPSAVQAASNSASNVLNAFPGCCTLTQPPDVYVGSTPISSTSTMWSGASNTPLSAGTVNTDANVYSIKVVLTGQVNPLFTINLPFFGSIPGLTQGFPTSVVEERIFENPTGLTQ